ncbi:MAG: lysyl-tRNA synthetase, class II [Parcubacteria group bacterium Gr01-1014_66]|nr:MAG: lysyl-tRNA synthetase, class II [Parcubacteria group bacterium Gr01-1014_66]
MALEEIRNERVKKLTLLRARGIDPYPAETMRTHTIADLLAAFDTYATKETVLTIAGRVSAKREHGGSIFFDIQDGTEKIQCYLKKEIGKEQFQLFLNTIDIGDLLAITGIPFKTKRQEKSILVQEWRILTKSLLPMPEKWHGLQDVEERFRKRYLDILINDAVRERFIMRARILSFIRKFHETRGFLEVETPMLHPIPGGTLAKPFMTHHNALDIDLYLRIAPELYLKRLLVAGYERVFEIGKSFRNEGIDATHNPEFTMLESYAAYWNEENMMNFVEELFIALAKDLGKTQLEENDKTILFKKAFVRTPFTEILSRYAQITDYEHETRESLAMRARQLGIETVHHESKGKIADEIYKKICKPYIIQPTFLINHPLDISPLAKKRTESLNEVRRLQLIIGGTEVANGWAELNDPIDQRERLEEQERERQGGEEEAMHMDEEFLEAMEYGMPPAAGLGIGIDRVAMLFTRAKNIREVVLFPTMRPK